MLYFKSDSRLEYCNNGGGDNNSCSNGDYGGGGGGGDKSDIPIGLYPLSY
jgi:hypothetical protein